MNRWHVVVIVLGIIWVYSMLNNNEHLLVYAIAFFLFLHIAESRQKLKRRKRDWR
jgi:hypothetical protein